MTKPTREEVDQLIIEAQDWLQSRDVVVLKKLHACYLAQEEELNEAIKEAAKWRRIRKPTHGPCCTCQGCGLHHDECRCDLEEVCDELDQLKAENQALKASMEAEYIERQAKHIQELVKENEALKELAKGCAAKPRAMQDLMKKHGLAIRDHDDPMQKLAFTLYTELVESAVSARDLLEGEQP